MKSAKCAKQFQKLSKRLIRAADSPENLDNEIREIAETIKISRNGQSGSAMGVPLTLVHIEGNAARRRAIAWIDNAAIANQFHGYLDHGKVRHLVRMLPSTNFQNMHGWSFDKAYEEGTALALRLESTVRQSVGGSLPSCHELERTVEEAELIMPEALIEGQALHERAKGEIRFGALFEVSVNKNTTTKRTFSNSRTIGHRQAKALSTETNCWIRGYRPGFDPGNYHEAIQKFVHSQLFPEIARVHAEEPGHSTCLAFDSGEGKLHEAIAAPLPKNVDDGSEEDYLVYVRTR